MEKKTQEAPKRKKVLFLAQHFITLYSFRRELIERLAAEGHEVVLSLPESEDNSYFTKLGCRIVSTDIDRRGINPLKDLKLISFYRRMIPRENPDLVLSYTIKPNVYGALALRGKRRPDGQAFRQICNITGTGGTFLENNLVAKICRLLYRHSVKRAYKVFFQNTGDRDMFLRYGMVGKQNYDMLPGSGVNLDQFHTVPLPEGDEVNFIFMGRVMKLKGMDEFLEAARIIRREYPNTRFWIAGFIEEGEYKEKVASYEADGSVVALGFQKNIVSWIEKSHCTILPSHGGEGVPNVLLETAAMGRICIGSRIAGTEDVIDDGKTGYLFTAGDTEDLVRAIRKVLALTPEERTAMGLAGRAKVEREFDRRQVVEKYMREVELA